MVGSLCTIIKQENTRKTMNGNTFRQKAVPYKEKGVLLHEERPFIHLLNESLANEACDNCYKKSEDIKVCKRCNKTSYCDVSCQKEAWSVHKHECARLKNLPSNRELPHAARFLARIIMKLKSGGDKERGYYNDKKKFRLFKDLMSHYPDVKADSQRSEHAMSLFAVLSEFLGPEKMPNFAEFVGLYGRMIVNGFSILDGEMNTIGTGIYLGASTIDHSCDPNAVAVFDGTTLRIKTLKEIPAYDWFKIRISYVETLQTKYMRNSELKSTYFFECTCERCSDDFDSEVALFCPECNKGVAAPSKRECFECGSNISDDFYKIYEEVLNLTITHIQNMKNVILLDVCKICLEKQKNVFHWSNVLHVRILDMAFEASISLQNWELAVEYGKQLIRGFRHWYGNIHPLTGLLFMKLSKILALLGKSYQEELSAAGEILKLTHGINHPLFQEYRALKNSCISI